MSVTDNLYQIGEAASLSATTPRTLRHYEELGLITPRKAGERGMRLYTDFDLKLVRDIQQLSTIGFSLEEIRQIMGLKRVFFTPDGDERRWNKTEVPLSAGQIATLRERTHVIRQTIDEQQALLRRLDGFLQRFSDPA